MTWAEACQAMLEGKTVQRFYKSGARRLTYALRFERESVWHNVAMGGWTPKDCLVRDDLTATYEVVE